MKRSEYLALAEQGAFRDQRVELVFGQVVEMGHVNRPHREAVRVLMELGDSLPEPDFYITTDDRTAKDFVSKAGLVIEVADTSLAFDRNEKAMLYALSEVHEYWIVDVVHGELEIRRDRDPDQARWRTITTHRAGEVVRPLAFPDIEIAVSAIVGR